MFLIACQVSHFPGLIILKTVKFKLNGMLLLFSRKMLVSKTFRLDNWFQNLSDRIIMSLFIVYSSRKPKNRLHRRQSGQQTAHTPFHDMLPHLHTIYNDVILLDVLTEI
jgi:hypothetical protein